MAQGDFQLGVSLPMEKALTTHEDGDLVIEGYAADYQPDREGEAFQPGVFEKAIAQYISRGAPLMFHHQHDKQLGQVEELRPDGQGLFIKARIPRPSEGSPLVDTYNKIKRGMMRGLSVYGRAIRERTRQGVKIVGVDLQEISVTPMPVGPNAMFEVARKAFPEDFDPGSVTDEDAAAVRAWFDARYDALMEKLEKSASSQSEGNQP